MKLAKSYYDCTGCDTRIQVHQGGTRSGKTYSILLALIEWCYRNAGSQSVVSIVRATSPALRATAMRDFFEILHREGIYDEKHHNRSFATYELFGNFVEFVATDSPQKIRGRKREVLFINEANELTLEHWRQLTFRTTYKIILDYNPSEEYHWIYDEVIPRDDASFFQSTYLDNPFLDATLIAEIERLKDTDPFYWQVYGLGERGQSRETIFITHPVKAIPEGAKELGLGLDWGYVNDPTAIVRVHLHGDEVYVEQLVYETGLTNSDIAQRLKDLGIQRNTPIIADSAEPKSIDEIHRYGFNIKPAKKGPDSVRQGIDIMRRHKLHVLESGTDTLKEFRNYKWDTDKNGKVLNVPRDDWNHAIDATRYVAMTYLRHRAKKYFVR